MPVKIAINGMGRIGRLVLRHLVKHPEIEVVAFNDLIDPDHLAYLIKYDSVHRNAAFSIEAESDGLIINGKKVVLFSEKDPEKLPWKELGVDIVIESTGVFTKKADLEKHLKSGAKLVILSAPAKDDVKTIVMGVNDTSFDPNQDKLISNASCTTNCLAPVAKALDDNFGIEEGLMTTIHAVTATQPCVDGPSKKDWRGGRSALANIIPASTGAAKAVGLCLPHLQGKLTGMALRVPVVDVSVVDLTVKTKKATSLSSIIEALEHTSKTSMKGILHVTHEDVVSSDWIGSTFSSIVDAKASIELNERFFKLIAWYDNEAGYATRLADLTLLAAKKAQF